MAVYDAPSLGMSGSLTLGAPSGASGEATIQTKPSNDYIPWLNAGVNLITGLWGQPARTTVVQAPSSPSWLMPAAIGGGLLLAIFLLRR